MAKNKEANRSSQSAQKENDLREAGAEGNPWRLTWVGFLILLGVSVWAVALIRAAVPDVLLPFSIGVIIYVLGFVVVSFFMARRHHDAAGSE